MNEGGHGTGLADNGRNSPIELWEGAQSLANRGAALKEKQKIRREVERGEHEQEKAPVTAAILATVDVLPEQQHGMMPMMTTARVGVTSSAMSSSITGTMDEVVAVGPSAGGGGEWATESASRLPLIRTTGTTTTPASRVPMMMMIPRVNNNNLYSPFYYGDSHIEVGHPFAITCIVPATESIQWQKDGDILEMGTRRRIEGIERKNHDDNNIEMMMKKRSLSRPVVVMAVDQIENYNRFNWDAAAAKEERDGTEEREETIRVDKSEPKVALRRPRADDDVNGAVVVEGGGEGGDVEKTRQRDDKSVSAVDDAISDAVEDINGWDGQLVARAKEEEEDAINETPSLWWKSLEADENRMLKVRRKRNVSELGGFNLRRYYSAVVDYKNFYRTPIVEEFLSGRADEPRFQESLRVEESLEMDPEVDSNSIHDFVFSWDSRSSSPGTG